ncbi:MAG: cobalt-zinc-cadmium efflux system protein [Parcubacteria bacterium C7867-001]|nr:MAG: cobalt-zinc-cadmium efflux system protein [Parcubacteria bacterium C7867-001]
MSKHSHDSQGNIKIALFLNICFTIIELIGGLLTNSLAILSDALHDFGDTIVLSLAWYAEKKSKQGPDEKRTYGYARLSVFSALASGAVLIGGSLFIVSQAIPRLFNPEAVNAPGMMILAVVGIVFNGIGAYRLKKGKGISERVLSWHLFEDVFGWTAILIGGGLIYLFDLPILDPILTIGFTLFILWGVIRSMGEVSNILLEGVPDRVNLKALKNDIQAFEGVLGLHDVHVWSLEGKTNVLSGHIVINPQSVDEGRAIQQKIKVMLKEKHDIEHATIELETNGSCEGKPC